MSTGDIEDSVQGYSSKTLRTELRDVKRQLAAAKEDAQKTHDEQQDDRITNLEHQLAAMADKLLDPEKGIVPQLEKTQIKHSQAIGILRWLGGIVGGLIVSGIAAALFGG